MQDEGLQGVVGEGHQGEVGLQLILSEREPVPHETYW